MAWEKEGAKAWALPGYGLDRPATPTVSIPQGELISPTKPTFVPNPFLQRYRITPNLVEGRVSPSTTFVPFSHGQPSFPVRGYRAKDDKSSHKGDSKVSPGKRRWLSGLRSDAIVRLPSAPIRRNFTPGDDPTLFEAAKTLSRPAGRERILELVSESTGAFVKQASPSDRHLLIWGEPAQVTEARDILLKLIEQFYGPRTPNGLGPWSKVHPQYAEDVEQDGIEKAVQNALFALREEPTTKFAYPNELLFVWPREGPSSRQCLGDQLEKLDPIRKDSKVHIFLRGDSEDYISVRGNADVDMAQIVAQLRELWKAAVAKSDIRIKAYLVEPPKLSTMQDKVSLFQDDKIVLPVYHGMKTITDNTPDTAMSLGSVRAENDKILLHSFQSALSKAHFFAGLLRMRIHFGSLVIDHFRKPTNGVDGYTLQEFREMMLHEKAGARLLPGMKSMGEDLISRCMSAREILAPLDPSGSLSDIKTMAPTYAASFEFSGVADSQLRLEVSFRQRALEIEQGRHRWFKTHKGSDGQTRKLHLQVGVVDFSRSDWQADIEFFEPVPSDEIKPTLVQFQRTIRFDDRIRKHGMTAPPRRKILFDNPNVLASFTEKAFIQLRVKNTKYILELARFDRYSARPRSAWNTAPIVSWGATLFDPDWDTMLGSGLDGEGQKKPGKFTARFETLFPSYNRMGDDSDDQGFWEFFKKVDEIAELLGAVNIGSEELSTGSKSRIAGDLLDAELDNRSPVLLS